jgi:phenylalanyl-tRNA synthetase beta chain
VKILLSWLDDLVELGPLRDDPEKLAALLTRAGLAVESIDRVGATVEGVVTARVVRTDTHPDAAKVQRVYVDAGDGAERHVWCGAFNFGPGDVVPLATLGTTMPDGRTIERRGILGIESEGMLCSARELGLGDDHGGIVILPARVPLGVPYGEALGLQPDVVFDLDLTRNRPDAWGHRGVAREVAAALGSALRPLAPTAVATGPARSATVDIIDGDRCGRFSSTVLSGIRVTDSPAWMQRRLTAVGMRPINNVVDVSNYVMLELNQPNHAYDLETLAGGGFVVRCARDGETITTLDGERRELGPDDLLICDAADRPIGIAGVMGGLDTEIGERTTVVALEVAWFVSGGVMRTVERLGLRSEASARFERGVDPYGIDAAVDRFVDLLRETCPDLVVHAGPVDARAVSLPAVERSVEVRIAQVNRILGTNLGVTDVATLLGPIGFSVTPAGDDDVVRVALPSWRPDCADEIDIVEEVARCHGFERLGSIVPRSSVSGGLSPIQVRRRRLRDVVLGLGCSEAMPNPFLAPDTARRAGLDPEALTITNPLVADESVLRTSLRPGLLRALSYNESHRRLGVWLFEVGHVYRPTPAELPDEVEMLGIVLAGAGAPDAVRVWREISAALGVGARIDQSIVPAGLHPTRSATLSAGPSPLGAVGEVHPGVLAEFGISERVAVVELDLVQLLGRLPKPAQWRPVGRTPSTDLDLAFALGDDVTADKLDKAIRQAAGSLLVDLDLFDVYRGPGVAAGSRSLAYRLRLQSPDRTLVDADVAAVRAKVESATSKLGATLRS